MRKRFIVSIITILLGLCFLLFLFFFFRSSLFISIDADAFKKEGYTEKELMLFADIAFPYNRIRKWNTDIKVEIKYTDRLKESDILEIDSIIKILSPLIHPLKISRVSSDGNLIVYRKVDSIPISGRQPRGFCYIPPLIKSMTYNIVYAEVYDWEYSIGPEILLHEFEHAIGLQHPSKQYPFYMNIRGSYEFKSLEEMERCKVPYYISEQEKRIIKMLYSSFIKSGLDKKTFIKKAKLIND